MEYRLTNSNIGSIHAEDLYNYTVKTKQNIFARFLNWCTAQQENRYFWLAAILFGQIGAMLPITAYAILFFGSNNLALWIIALTVNLPNLVLNLAALPTKITLPFLFLALLTEAVIILYCFSFAVLH